MSVLNVLMPLSQLLGFHILAMFVVPTHDQRTRVWLHMFYEVISPSTWVPPNAYILRVGFGGSPCRPTPRHLTPGLYIKGSLHSPLPPTLALVTPKRPPDAPHLPRYQLRMYSM